MREGIFVAKKNEIDGNEAAKKIMPLYREGKIDESKQAEYDFLELVYASGEDHCSCPFPCERHGDCKECVILHRGHEDHLPYCLWKMVDEQDDKGKLTKH